MPHTRTLTFDIVTPDERDGIPHNLIAHPLLILCPPLGRWLHARTQPTVPTRAARNQPHPFPRFHLFGHTTH